MTGFSPAADDESRFRRRFAATQSQEIRRRPATDANALIDRQNRPERRQAGFGHF
jgi:hypothetical protein